MTEKRFEFRVCTDKLYYFYIIDNETGKEYKYLIDDELLKLLNELNNKNEELQFYLELCETNNNYVIKQIKEEIKQLAEENKELKQLIKKVMDERVVDYPLLCKLKEMVKE